MYDEITFPKLPEKWDEWEITELIGSGAFGDVYRMESSLIGESETERLVSAIKIIRIPRDVSEERAAMRDSGSFESAKLLFHNRADIFMREILTMNVLKGNENIVSIKDYHIEDTESGIGKKIYIQMEYLSPLSDYLLTNIIEEKEVIRMGMDICKALICCERANILHRDIKLDNIFLDDAHNFKLGDFGIARMNDHSQGSFTIQAGSLSYMAPEIYFGKFYNSSVDIYSLGIMLYKMMNHNRVPFVSLEKQIILDRDLEEALDKRLKNTTAMPKPVDASERLAAVILKACAFKPEHRYRKAQDMYDDLERVYLDQKPKSNRKYYIAGVFLVGILSAAGGFTAARLLAPKTIEQYQYALTANDQYMDSSGNRIFNTGEQKQGVVDADGRVLIEPEYLYIYPMIANERIIGYECGKDQNEDGHADQCAYARADGVFLIPNGIYDHINPCLKPDGELDGFEVVNLGNRGYLDAGGSTVILEMQPCSSIVPVYLDGKRNFMIKDRASSYTYVVDGKRNTLVEEGPYDEIKILKDEKNQVVLGYILTGREYLGYADADGVVKIHSDNLRSLTPVFDDEIRLRGYIAESMDQRFGYISPENNAVIPFGEYVRIEQYLDQDDWGEVKRSILRLAVDVVSQEDSAEDDWDDEYVWNVFADLDGNILAETGTYDSIYPRFDDQTNELLGFSRYKKGFDNLTNRSCGYIDANGNELVSNEEGWDNVIACSEKGEIQGFIVSAGTYEMFRNNDGSVGDAFYELKCFLDEYHAGLLSTMMGGKCCLLDTNGLQVTECIYDSIIWDGENYRLYTGNDFVIYDVKHGEIVEKEA